MEPFCSWPGWIELSPYLVPVPCTIYQYATIPHTKSSKEPSISQLNRVGLNSSLTDVDPVFELFEFAKHCVHFQYARRLDVNPSLASLKISYCNPSCHVESPSCPSLCLSNCDLIFYMHHICDCSHTFSVWQAWIFSIPATCEQVGQTFSKFDNMHFPTFVIVSSTHDLARDQPDRYRSIPILSEADLFLTHLPFFPK